MVPSIVRMDPVVRVADMTAGDTPIGAVLGPRCPVLPWMPHRERVAGHHRTETLR